MVARNMYRIGINKCKKKNCASGWLCTKIVIRCAVNKTDKLLAILMLCAYTGNVRICVVPINAVFCSSLISCFPSIFFKQFLGEFLDVSGLPLFFTDISLSIFLDTPAKLQEVCPSLSFRVSLSLSVRPSTCNNSVPTARTIILCHM